MGESVDRSVDPVVLSRRLAHKGFQLLTAKLGRILHLMMKRMMMMMMMRMMVMMMMMMVVVMLLCLFSLELVEQWRMGSRQPAGKQTAPAAAAAIGIGNHHHLS